jgi:hypothetical protein
MAYELRQGEAQGILDFIEKEDPQQLTPQSPCTSTSTINAAFGSEPW